VVWGDSLRQGGYTGLREGSRVGRVALGIRADGVVVALAGEALTMQELAQVMRSWLSCTDAMALDGGGSATMAWEGRVLMGGARALPSYVVAGVWASGGGADGGGQDDGGRPWDDDRDGDDQAPEDDPIPPEISRRLNDFPVSSNFACGSLRARTPMRFWSIPSWWTGSSDSGTLWPGRSP